MPFSVRNDVKLVFLGNSFLRYWVSSLGPQQNICKRQTINKAIFLYWASSLWAPEKHLLCKQFPSVLGELPCLGPRKTSVNVKQLPRPSSCIG
jgi:hypothetical protein